MKKIILIVWIIFFVLNAYFENNLDYYLQFYFSDSKEVFTFYEYFYHITVNTIRFFFSVLSFIFLILICKKR